VCLEDALFLTKGVYMKKILILLIVLVFASCASKIAIKVSKTQEVFVDVDIKPSESTKKIVKSLSSIAKDDKQTKNGQNGFQEEKLENIMLEGGVEIISFKRDGNLDTNAKIKFPASSKEIDSSIFNVSEEGSLVLSLSKEKLRNFFSGMSEEQKGYLELLMAPSMQEDDMSSSEYISLIASSYGKKVAGELKHSRIKLYIEVPNTIKNVSVSPKAEYTIKGKVLHLSLPLISFLVMQEPIIINVEYPN